MIRDRDTLVSANILLDKYGEAAELRAARRAGEMLDRGDFDGHYAWLQIVEAVRQLTAMVPPEETKPF